ncbi:MAG: hypothetical protein AB8B74_12255 [Crocinitomicaceae bacterium]
MNIIRNYVVAFSLIISCLGYGQNYQYGFEISPCFNYQLQNSKITQTWSTISGTGFQIGAFINKRIGEHSRVGSALKFEYVGFNQKQGNVLINSFRIASVNIPLLFQQEIGVTKHWFYKVGIGLNYNFLNRQLQNGFWLNLNDIANQFQPYASVGIDYTMDGKFILGIDARYHILDLWMKEVQDMTGVKTTLFSFDFSLKYNLASNKK